MRYYFSLFVLFAVGALVLAAPTDKKPTTTGVNKEDVQIGQIRWPRLKFVKPRDPDVKRHNADWQHPVIVVSDVDAHNEVKVAQISRGHPTHWGSVEPASNYADIEGSIHLGPPKTVHIDHLGRNKLGAKVVRPGRLQPLIDRINANCPADKMAGCEPSGSAQDNTAPSGSEHDHSKQGSQKSSSSQGSRPGSPKQSSQESSSSQGPQGSQLGGSKQGGSSDDGWQAVTGRRGNKARGSRNK